VSCRPGRVDQSSGLIWCFWCLLIAQLEKRKVWLDDVVAEYEKSNKRSSERLKRANLMVSPPTPLRLGLSLVRAAEEQAFVWLCVAKGSGGEGVMVPWPLVLKTQKRERDTNMEPRGRRA
jgi:hypothetical protein